MYGNAVDSMTYGAEGFGGAEVGFRLGVVKYSQVSATKVAFGLSEVVLDGLFLVFQQLLRRCRNKVFRDIKIP